MAPSLVAVYVILAKITDGARTDSQASEKMYSAGRAGYHTEGYDNGNHRFLPVHPVPISRFTGMFPIGGLHPIGSPPLIRPIKLSPEDHTSRSPWEGDIDFVKLTEFERSVLAKTVEKQTKGSEVRESSPKKDEANNSKVIDVVEILGDVIRKLIADKNNSIGASQSLKQAFEEKHKALIEEKEDWKQTFFKSEDQRLVQKWEKDDLAQELQRLLEDYKTLEQATFRSRDEIASLTAETKALVRALTNVMEMYESLKQASLKSPGSHAQDQYVD